MESRIEEFREFVNKHTLLRNEVRNGKRTWQNIYEEWVLYGDGDRQWDQYIDNSNNQGNGNTTKPQSNQGNGVNFDSFKNILSYVQKMNPDTVNKTLNTVQRVIQIAQTIGGSSSKIPKTQGPMMSSMYNDWWD